MIVDYVLALKHRPSEREVWLMSKSMEKDGFKVDLSVMRALESGEIKYHNHQIYKLCRHCMDYLPLDEFYDNKRYVMDKSYVCKKCTAVRRRIKKYAEVGYISEVGMESESYGFGMNLKESTKEIFRGRLLDEHNDSKAD